MSYNAGHDDPFFMSTGSSPSSSPPSSPALGPVDSSPPSSPSIRPVASLPESPGPPDPYAGSNKWARSLRQYNAGQRVKPLGWGATSVVHGRDDAADERSYNTHSRGSCRGRAPQQNKGTHRSSAHAKMGRNTPSTPGTMDPYAASAGGTWKPPHREKRSFARSASTTSAYSTSSVLSTDTASSSALLNEHAFSLRTSDDDINFNDESTAPLVAEYGPRVDSEEDIWERTIATAIENANGEINLQNASLMSKPLTYIPSIIGDLANLVVLPSCHASQEPPSITSFAAHRPFTRSITVPASSPRSDPSLDDDTPRKLLQKAASTTFVRTASLSNSPSGSRSEIKLFLSNNQIKSLPLELFQLTGLTVLALRSNCISVLPSQVAQLTNLRELSIPSNRLRWLPSEMLSMQPMHLRVINNRWIQPPPEEDPSTVQPLAQSEHAHLVPTSASTRTHVSQTTLHFDIPPLTELCLRFLLSPVVGSDTQSEGRPETVLEAFYALPFSGADRSLPPTLLQTLRACLPSAIAKPAAVPSPSKKPRRGLAGGAHALRADSAEGDDAGESPPSIGVCPSPAHRALGGGWAAGRVPVFVRHAEERFTWEREIAGTDLKAECGGAGVPVRWRGCWKGCLEFLDTGRDRTDDNMDLDEGEEVIQTDWGVAAEPDDNVTGIHIVQFTTAPLTRFEDFE